MQTDDHLPTPTAGGGPPSDDAGWSLDEYRQLFEKAPEPYLLTDATGTVLLANQRARDLFAADTLAGRSIAGLLHRDSREGLDQQLERAGRGEGIHSWEVRLCDTATEPRALASIEPADEQRDGGELRWVLWDAMPLELVRERLSRLLEDSQGDAAALRALAEWQATLLGSAAQDMQAPLQVIGSTIDSLLDDTTALATPVARTMLERAGRQTMRLRRLLPTLLQLGQLQLEGPGVRRDRVCLPDLAEQTLHDLELDIDVDLDFPVDVVHADPMQLTRVLLELLTHADEYGPDDTALRLGSVARGVDVELYLDVSDYELTKSVRQVMFSPFLGTGRGGEEANGDDLGLSLVAVFARMHGGRAWVEDTASGGASFRVLLSNALPDSHREAG